MRRNILLTILAILVIATPVLSSPSNTIDIPNSFTAQTVAESAKVNANFNEIATKFNAHTHTDITSLGTVTTGNWNATAITAQYGGTGLATITDGGVMLGSGTGAVTPMAVLADGEFIVGDGTTDPVAESGATARTSLGLGTGDSPTFTGVTATTGITTAGLTATANLDIGAYELRAQTLESDVATGTAPLTIASTTKVTNLGADTLDTYNTSTSAASTVIYVSDGSNYLPDSTVDTGAIVDATVATGDLNTAASEQSYEGNVGELNTFGGGQYGFYPQIKLTGSSPSAMVSMCGRQGDYEDPGTTYVTNVWLDTGAASGQVIYANQLYVTASGTDLWVFLKLDKSNKRIISSWQAYDHPAYGNGGDPEALPHPFRNYDPSEHEIVLLDKETCNILKAESEATGKSILTILNEEYKPNLTKTEPYEPLHSGKFLDEAPIMVDSIPDYIKVRKMTKMTPQDKQDKEDLRNQIQSEWEAKKLAKENKKTQAKDKLKTLGLTEDELEALFE